MQRERNLHKLGEIIRDLREARDEVQKTVGEQAFEEKKSQKFVSDLETGRIGHDHLHRYVTSLQDYFGVDAATAAAMDRLCQTPATMREWNGEHEHVPRYFHYFMAQEIWAESIHQWQDNRIPGLIQSPGYMRALFAQDHDPDDVDALTTARLGRRRLFERENPPLYEAILHENAVRRLHPNYGREIAVEQLLHIVALMGKYPAVTVRILIEDGKTRELPLGHTSVHFPRAHGDFAYLEPWSQGDYEDDESSVKATTALIGRLRDAALSRDASIELLLGLAAE